MTFDGQENNFFCFYIVLLAQWKGRNMNKPSGENLLATLIKLLAEQEGVKITYQLEKKGTT